MEKLRGKFINYLMLCKITFNSSLEKMYVTDDCVNGFNLDGITNFYPNER